MDGGFPVVEFAQTSKSSTDNIWFKSIDVDESVLIVRWHISGCGATFQKRPENDGSGRPAAVSCSHLDQLVDDLNLSQRPIEAPPGLRQVN